MLQKTICGNRDFIIWLWTLHRWPIKLSRIPAYFIRTHAFWSASGSISKPSADRNSASLSAISNCICGLELFKCCRRIGTIILKLASFDKVYPERSRMGSEPVLSLPLRGLSKGQVCFGFGLALFSRSPGRGLFSYRSPAKEFAPIWAPIKLALFCKIVSDLGFRDSDFRPKAGWVAASSLRDGDGISRIICCLRSSFIIFNMLFSIRRSYINSRSSTLELV